VRRRLLLFPAAAVLFSTPGAAQEVDVLANAPPTNIYVETDYSGNEGLVDCDWYWSAESLLGGEAEVGRGCQVNLRIRGTINREGAFLFYSLVEHLESLQHRAAAVVLDSRGGDAEAAISIGRLIRQSDLFSQVPVETRVSEGYQSVCLSACVVVFAAGYRRSLEFDIDGGLPSRLGIHGPGQFDRSDGRYDSSTANREIQRVGARLKAYFDSIDVAAQLVDDMFALPFDDIHLLSRDELIGYGLYE
jgi:hypothetical protein